MTYWNILKTEYRNRWFYLYVFCWMPALLVVRHEPWWVLVGFMGQLPFVFPLAVMAEEMGRRKKKRTSRAR